MSIKHFDKCELLLPMTGANNGTVFTDFSLRKRVVTRSGSVVTSTAESKFTEYGSSGFIPGGSGVGLRPGFTLPLTGDFICQCWAKIAGSAAQHPAFATGDGGATDGRYMMAIGGSDAGANVGKIHFFAGGSGGFSRYAGAADTGGWRHYKWSRASGTNRMYINGVKVDEFSNSYALQDRNLDIGNYAAFASYSFNGYLQDVMVSYDSDNGGNFTPPPRMTQRKLTRTNTGTDSHEFDRAVLFDWAGSAYALKATPNASGNFTATNLIDLEYGVALIKEGCDPICRGPVSVDED
jgi:hypothetical protein